MKDEKFGYHYLWIIPTTWWYSFINYVKSLKSKLKGIYLRKTNTTAKQALAILERCVDDGSYRCPECRQMFRNELVFIDHCEDEHGFPRDMDVLRFYETDIPKYNEVKKASSEYLKYL